MRLGLGIVASLLAVACSASDATIPEAGSTTNTNTPAPDPDADAAVPAPPPSTTTPTTPSNEPCYADADGDGFRTDAIVPGAFAPCTAKGLAPASAPSGDCADGDATIHPGAKETPDDGVDADCDGKELCFVDEDGDGFRPVGETTKAVADLSCSGPGLAKASAPATDCYDKNAKAFPGQTLFFITHRGDGSFDYDCDGKQTVGNATVAEKCPFTCPVYPQRMSIAGGWVSFAPGCGETWRMTSACTMQVGTCRPLTSDVTQSCR